MTPEFQLLMKLCAAGATGKPVQSPPAAQIDWQKVFSLAKEQGSASLAAYGLELSPELACPQEIRRHYTSMMYGSAVKNILKKERILQLLAEMEAAGFRAVQIKGYAIADCYSAPECRISADTDIWIDPAQEREACKFMARMGFQVDPRWKNGHHAVCWHPELGHVELHVLLYDEIVEEVWFGKMDGSEYVQEPFLRVQTPEGEFTTLGHTDHLIFLALHTIKHFIISGMSIRMMLDVALYLSAHRHEIDLDRFWQTMRALRYETLMNVILWSAADSSGLDRENFPGMSRTRPAQMQAVLDDLELGGSMGNNDKKAREEGFYEFSRLAFLKDKSTLRYRLYMTKWKLELYMTSLFPTRRVLAQRYPCVLERPWLTPFVWLHRLVFRGTRFLFKGKKTTIITSDDTVLSDSAQGRVQLFRELEMV